MAKSIFGQQLKSLRESFGLTQAQLAFKLDISASAIGMYEQGRREPDSAILAKICTEFNTTTDHLLGLDKQKINTPREVNEIIDEFTHLLSEQKELMFNGKPISETDREKIVAAIRVAAAIAMDHYKQ